MIFSSPRFFVFLCVLLLALCLIRSREIQKRVLMLGSCAFYAAWDYRYLALLGFVSVIDYWVANRIFASEKERVRRAWLLVSLISNLGILGYFKYCDFFIENLNAVLGAEARLSHVNVILPAGISFYTFKTMSYTIDVYRRELIPERRWLDYATFVTFFPELIAGPIVRASIFLPQMGRDIRPTISRVGIGGSIFLVGLTKKLLVADVLAKVADPMFGDPTLYSGKALWLGLLAYTFQIYCDFSGYSDMAIGVAKMFGFDLPRNFALPYLSADVAEFWRRWHITLSTWLRDYLYIPLGGNRKGLSRTYFNLIVTMLLGGLWHGASWNFVLWGALHGGALAMHRAYRDSLGERRRLPNLVATPLTFLFVMLCWVPFRCPDFGTTREVLSRLFSVGSNGATWVPTLLFPALGLVILGHVIGWLLEHDAAGRSSFMAPILARFDARLLTDPVSGFYVRFGLRTIPGAFLITLWLLALFYLAPLNTTPFIYFRF